MTTLRIATRKSPLALWQAHHVVALLKEKHPNVKTELLAISTRGDEILDKSLAKIGGKGLFIKELEVAMQEERADLAVHSMKDVPVQLPTGMILESILERADPSDALVSAHHTSIASLPEGAVVGTSSLRRQSQILNYRPDLHIKPLRGNVGTRLQKLDEGQFDAIILASAGLKRLELEQRIAQRIDWKLCMPAGGQGAIGIECRTDDARTREIILSLNHEPTHQRVVAERAVNNTLGGSCTSPLAAYASLKDGIIMLRARVAAPDGARILETFASDEAPKAQIVGERAAQALERLGARQYL